MANTFFFADPHFGHENILKFMNPNGTKLRDFRTIEGMDEVIIMNWNKTVRPADRVYLLGDVSMAKMHIKTVGRLNGRKVLIKGNHDVYPLKEYMPYFDDIRAYKVFPAHNIICSHIPVHPRELEGRFRYNIHGHLHAETIPDPRYINVSAEQINYTPKSLDDILKGIQQ